jgi:hypothetical protein
MSVSVRPARVPCICPVRASGRGRVLPHVSRQTSPRSSVWRAFFRRPWRLRAAVVKARCVPPLPPHSAAAGGGGATAPRAPLRGALLSAAARVRRHARAPLTSAAERARGWLIYAPGVQKIRLSVAARMRCSARSLACRSLACRSPAVHLGKAVSHARPRSAPGVVPRLGPRTPRTPHGTLGNTPRTSNVAWLSGRLRAPPPSCVCHAASCHGAAAQLRTR